MTPLEINRLCGWLITFRDTGDLSRGDRDMLADVCNALDGYAKLTRALDAALASARQDALEEAAQMAEVDARAISKGAAGRLGSTEAIGDHIAQAIRAIASIERAAQGSDLAKAEDGQ